MRRERAFGEGEEDQDSGGGGGKEKGIKWEEEERRQLFNSRASLQTRVSTLTGRALAARDGCGPECTVTPNRTHRLASQPSSQTGFPQPSVI